MTRALTALLLLAAAMGCEPACTYDTECPYAHRCEAGRCAPLEVKP